MQSSNPKCRQHNRLNKQKQQMVIISLVDNIFCDIPDGVLSHFIWLHQEVIYLGFAART